MITGFYRVVGSPRTTAAAVTLAGHHGHWPVTDLVATHINPSNRTLATEGLLDTDPYLYTNGQKGILIHPKP